MLNDRQKAFADYFLECGNATEAAKRAGYSEKTARQMGAENLSKPSISAYIKQRTAEQDAARVASADEVLRFYTSVMRGEVKDAFGLDAGLAERLKAADSLYKRHAAAGEKQKSTMEKLDSLLEEMRSCANVLDS